MKILHFSTIMIVVISSMTFCFMVSPVSALYSHGNLDLEKTSDTTTTQLEFDNSIITLEQYLNKTTYKVGETIYVYGQLRNVGTHDVYVSYLGPVTSSVLKDQNGKLVDSFGGAYVLEGGPYGNATLHPNSTTTLRVWDFPRNVVGGGPWSLHIQPAELVADEPGIYYVRSMINFNYRADITSEHSKAITLWSTPLQITVLPEKYTTMRLMIESAPTTLELVSPQDRHIHLRFFNATTNNPIKDVVFAMNVTKGNQTFLQNTFWTQSGSFTLNLKPGQRYLWTANPDHDPMDGLYYSKGDQIDIDTAYLTGDEYHFSIIPIFGYQVYSPIPHPQTGEKFETDLNLLSAYNKTIVPDVVPEFPFAIPVLIASIASLIIFYRMKFR